jgi:hypothetical protein
METPQSRGREFQQAAKNAAAQARDAVRQTTDDAVSALRAEAEAKAAERRDAVADYLGDISAAFDAASQTLESRGRSGVATLTRSAQAQADRLREEAAGRDVRHLIGEVERFARRRPALFFGGAFLLGYVAMQLLGRDEPQDENVGQPGYETDPGYGTDYGSGYSAAEVVR